MIALDGLGEVDRGGIERHAHGFDGKSWSRSGQKGAKNDQEEGESVHKSGQSQEVLSIREGGNRPATRADGAIRFS